MNGEPEEENNDENRPNWWMGVAAVLFILLCSLTYFVLIVLYSKVIPGG